MCCSVEMKLVQVKKNISYETGTPEGLPQENTKWKRVLLKPQAGIPILHGIALGIRKTGNCLKRFPPHLLLSPGVDLAAACWKGLFFLGFLGCQFSLHTLKANFLSPEAVKEGVANTRGLPRQNFLPVKRKDHGDPIRPVSLTVTVSPREKERDEERTYFPFWSMLWSATPCGQTDGQLSCQDREMV